MLETLDNGIFNLTFYTFLKRTRLFLDEFQIKNFLFCACLFFILLSNKTLSIKFSYIFTSKFIESVYTSFLKNEQNEKNISSIQISNFNIFINVFIYQLSILNLFYNLKLDSYLSTKLVLFALMKALQK